MSNHQDPTYHTQGKVNISLNCDQLENIIDDLYLRGSCIELADQLRAMFVAEYGTDRDKWDLPETTTAKDALHDPLIQYQIVYHDASPMSEWTSDLQSLLRRMDKLQLVMDYPVVIIDEHERLVEADSIGPAPDWLRRALDERAQTFEAAAYTADQMDKLNDTLPNDHPGIWFIDKE